eukprot:SAG31_NODE_13907_length_838_cov_1.248985_1_plen_25_part_01
MRRRQCGGGGAVISFYSDELAAETE